MKRLISALLLCALLLSACTLVPPEPTATPTQSVSSERDVFSLDALPEFSGTPYIAVNGNDPYFSETDYTTASFERYSELDTLGSCGVAYA